METKLCFHFSILRKPRSKIPLFRKPSRFNQETHSISSFSKSMHVSKMVDKSRNASSWQALPIIDLPKFLAFINKHGLTLAWIGICTNSSQSRQGVKTRRYISLRSIIVVLAATLCSNFVVDMSPHHTATTFCDSCTIIIRQHSKISTRSDVCRDIMYRMVLNVRDCPPHHPGIFRSSEPRKLKKMEHPHRLPSFHILWF